MEIDLNSGTSPIQMIVQQVIFEKNLLTKLEVTDTIINSLDEKTFKNVSAKKFQKELHDLFNDNKTMRKISYVSSIMDNVELCVEYLGSDYLSSQDYNYDANFEEELVRIKKRLQAFLGKLLKELNTGEGIEL